MTQHRVKQALNTFNLLLVATFLVLALYSALGQQIFPFVGQYRVALQNYISEQLQSRVEIRQLSGDMHILTPSVHIEGISMGDETDPILSIAAVDAVLDPRLSLLNLTPVFTSVRLSGVSIKIDPSQKKSVGPTDLVEESGDGVRRFVESLLLQQHLELNNVSIDFPLEGQMQTLALDHLVMIGDGFSRLMTGSVHYGKESTIQTGFRLFTQGSPYNLEEFYARGHMNLPKLDVNYWIQKLFQLDVFDEFNSSSKLNFEFKQGLLNYAKLTASSPKVSINENKSFENVESEIWLKQNNVDTWSLWLGNGSFTLNNIDWQLNDVAIKVSHTLQGNRWQGFVNNMDLDYLQGLLAALDVVPEKIKNILTDINATGVLKQFSVILQQQEKSSPQITLAGELDNVSIDSYIGIPKLENVSGVLAANKHSGRIQLNGKDTSVYLDSVYDHALFIEDSKGQIDWFIEKHQTHVSAKGLNLRAKDVGLVKGGFQIWAPNGLIDNTSLELNLSFSDVDLLAHKKLIPKSAVPSLQVWLNDNIKYGQVKEGLFYLYADFDKEKPLSQLQLYLNAENSALTYLDEWPGVDQAQGHLFIDNELLVGSFSSGTTLGGDINQLQLIYENDVLWLDGGLMGDTKGLFSYLQTTPLKDELDNVFENWEVDGRHFSELSLKVPLSGEDEILTELHADLSQSHMNIKDLGLAFNFINGQIAYSSKKGLNSDSLTANFWQRPFTVSMSSIVNDGDLKTDILFDGSVEMPVLKQWLKLPVMQPFSGSSSVNGRFIVDTSKDSFTGLKVSSNMKGISVDLPAPFKKSNQEEIPFTAEIALNSGQDVSLLYGDKAGLFMQLKNGSLFSCNVITPINKKSNDSNFSSEEGFFVDAKIESLVVEDWLEVWDKIESESRNFPSAEKTKNPIKKIELSADSVSYAEQVFKQVDSEIGYENGNWNIILDAPVAKGLVKYDPKAPIKIDLEYFHWPAMDSSEEEVSSTEKVDALAEIKPYEFPKLDLNVDEVYIGSTNYGRWNMLVEPLAQGVHFKNIDGFIKELSVKGDVHWVKPIISKSKQRDLGKKEFTEVNLALSSRNLSGIQAAWRSKPVIEAEKSNINVSLNWPASPASFDIKKAKGEIAIHLKDGRFLEAGEANALSAFGILNFSAIGRRLRLDFTDIYESGLHFDDVKGKATMENGLITIVDTLNIDGPSAKFAASGTVNTLNKELNQELSVTFPLSSTLPFVAILAGFAPPVAASLFVGERLVGDEIERFTSATYELTGSWDEPSLKLKKRFDNDIEGKKDKTFWHRMKDVFGVGD
jgi:uncharacterized protein (TIGR02099 family)